MGIIVFLGAMNVYIVPSFSPIHALSCSIRIWLGFLFWSRSRRLQLTMAVPDKVSFSLLFFTSLLSISLIGTNLFCSSLFVESLAWLHFRPNRGGWGFWVNWQSALHVWNFWKFLDDFFFNFHLITLKILRGLLCC